MGPKIRFLWHLILNPVIYKNILLLRFGRFYHLERGLMPCHYVEDDSSLENMQPVAGNILTENKLSAGCPIRFLYFPTAGNWLSSFSILIPTLGKWLFFNSHCENWFNSIFPLLGIEWIQISYCRELIKLIHNLKSHYEKMIDF